ncbi:cation:proton antiporter [Leucobacter sp. Z1108]|uniref:cation:proton antiporter n=1 Tax=Leucobacter sp. Z1108 TaxID=3439066 RepID=UPI003F2C3348
MDQFELTILLVPLAAVVAPLLAALVRRALVVPLVVFEIGLGVLIGPAGLGLVADGRPLELMSQLGLAMLFFMAGSEIDPQSMRGRTGKRAIWAWVASAALALIAGFLIGDSLAATGIIAIALTGTALGTITPILRDAGIARGPLGATISGAGAVGEFAPLIAISLFLSGHEPLAGSITLLLFVAVAVLAFWLASSGPKQWLHRMVSATLHTSGQFAIRFLILVLAAMVALALALGVDFLLGAFTAGLLSRVVLRGGAPDELHVIEAKLESVSFGFFVPIFFVATGVSFPLATLFGDPHALLLLPVFVLAILVIRGLTGFFTPERGTSFSDRRTSALFIATTLPLVIAVTQIGVEKGAIDESTAAAMVGAALVTVLLFPLLALVGRNDSVNPNRAESESADTDANADADEDAFAEDAHE